MEEEKIENEETVEEEKKENEETDESSDDLVFEDIDNETFTYTVDNNNIGSSNKKSYDNKTSYIYIIIGAIFLILIIVILVVLANGSTKKSSYNEIENKLVNASKNYYKENENLLPVNDGGKVSVDAETLISNNYLKPFSEMTKDDSSCEGYVEVYKSGDEYTYFPTLNCGEKYTTAKLVDNIIENGTVNSGDGLYSVNNEYIYRGEFPNNYVSFDGKTWRIIKINNDKSIKMISIEKDVEREVWDDRYNSSNNYYSGINDFRVSRVLEYLNKAYDNNTIISKKNKNLLVKEPWCIGKLSQAEAPISNLNLCSDTYDDLYIGLVNVEEVLNASIDKNCINTYNGECTNYNYFMYIGATWTLNASTDKTFKVFGTTSGTISVRDASNPNVIRPVININSNTVLKKGTGTSSDPYIIGD